MEKLIKFDDQVSHLFLSIREKVNEIVDYINQNENKFAASGSDTSRTTPNPEKGSQIKRLFKLYNLNADEYIYSRLIEDLEILFEANGETPFNINLFRSFINAVDLYEIMRTTKKEAFNQFMIDFNKIYKKDNPVPLLDNKDIENLIKSVIITFGNKVTGNNLISKLSKLQNGVTTDKENLKIEMVKVEGNNNINDFYIGKYPVTQAQWKAVMGNNPSHFKGDDLPVEQVSWNDVQEFLKKLNAQNGLNYRLPTEAEWEYAARGGVLSKGYKYAGGDDLDEIGWYCGNSGDKKLTGDWKLEKLTDNNCRTHPVGEKHPNELGIYDMSGNVWEWCHDWYINTFSNRVIRGGSWSRDAGYCRVSGRYFDGPASRYGDVGFRLAI